jgi:hypothetical protein
MSGVNSRHGPEAGTPAVTVPAVSLVVVDTIGVGVAVGETVGVAVSVADAEEVDVLTDVVAALTRPPAGALFAPHAQSASPTPTIAVGTR